MIVYELACVAHSHDESGKGPKAWRLWRAIRHFRNNDVPRVPEVGREFSFDTAGLYRFRCTTSWDTMGYRNLTNTLFPDVLVTRFRFALVPPHPGVRVLGAFACFDGDTAAFYTALQQAGFQVTIDEPRPNQHPKEPTPTGT